MNEEALKQLKTVVESAVRPVRATMARKRRMREELLAHLVAIFEEEAERLGDEQAALRQATLRFGEPAELSKQLQSSVPLWDRCWSILETLGYRPTESAWHLAARHFLVMLLINSAYVPLLVLAKGDLRNMPVEAQRQMAFVLVGAVFLTALFNVILSIALAPLLDKTAPLLASTRRRRILLAVACGLAVLSALVMPGFVGAAVLFVLMARQVVNQWRYQTEWA